MVANGSPKPGESIGSKAARLRKRLRSISRTRRQTLVKRSEYVDRLLNELISQISIPQSPIEASTSTLSRNGNPIHTESYENVSVLIASQSRYYDNHADTTMSALCNLTVTGSTGGSAVLRPYSEDISVLHNQLDFLSQELGNSRLHFNKSKQGEEETKAQLEILRSQLLEARHDAIELRLQAAETADLEPYAPNVKPAPGPPQAMSWEEQKRHLLRAFEAESEAIDFTTMTPTEFERLFVATKRALADRELEIQELKSMLDLQSQASANGLAMGASAISHILDADPFIQEERQRLSSLQEELQRKLRDAEIEISVERARIARDRLSLQNASQTLADENLAASANNLAAQESQQNMAIASLERKLVPGSIPRTRRWLQRLGLRDDE